MEVICKIKGIPIVAKSSVQWRGASASVAVSEDLIAVVDDFAPALQVSIFDPLDAATLDPRQVASVFVRAEHILLANLELLTRNSFAPAIFEWLLRRYLGQLVDVLDPQIDILLRGLDIRSDDHLARALGVPPESNPDLGLHGVRSFLSGSTFARPERAVVRAFEGRVQYALPFVTRATDVERYLASFPLAADERRLTLFLESPSALHSIDAFAGYDIAIGLKDVAQFFFAADRGSPAVANWIDYDDEELVKLVAAAVRSGVGAGSRVSVYQDPKMSRSYEEALDGADWLRSVPVGAVLGGASRALLRHKEG